MASLDSAVPFSFCLDAVVYFDWALSVAVKFFYLKTVLRHLWLESSHSEGSVLILMVD